MILLQLELLTFLFHQWKTLNPLMYRVSGFPDVSLSPKTIFYPWRDQNPPNNSSPNHEQIKYKNAEFRTC